MNIVKTCVKCGVTKRFIDFYKSRMSKDGAVSDMHRLGAVLVQVSDDAALDARRWLYGVFGFNQVVIAINVLGDDVPALKVKDVGHLCCNPVQTLTITHSLEHWNLNVIHESGPMLVRVTKPRKAFLDVAEKPNATGGILPDIPLVPPCILLLGSNGALMAWGIADAIRIHRRVAVPSHPSKRIKRPLSGNRHKGASVMGADSNNCHAVPPLTIRPLRVMGVVDSYAVVKGFAHDSFHTLFRYMNYITNYELHTLFRRAIFTKR